MRHLGALIGATLLVSLAFATPVSAHTISEAQAYGVADRLGERAYQLTSWADEWGDNCDRQTPWRYTCDIEIWSDSTTRDCWRYFDVVSPFYGYRLRLENLSAWTCG